jgi:siroheme synthase
VRFVTGHRRDDGSLDLNWQSLADPDTTLVVYMGLANLDEICARLIEFGLSADTPAAAIAHGTTRRQTVCRGRLADLTTIVHAENMQAPVLFVVGRTVALSHVLADIAAPEQDDRAPETFIASHG